MLSQVNNPYNPGAGSSPPALVGRDRELHAFEIAVERLTLGRPDRSQMLIGLRGVGKTVLLHEFALAAKRRDWASLHLECVEDTDVVAEVAELARRAIVGLSAAGRLAALASRAVGVLRSFQLTWSIPGGGSVVLGPDTEPVLGQADSGDLGRDLTDLLRAVGELAREKERGVLFTVDEVQHLSAQRLTPLLVALHEMSRLQLPLLVAGAGLPSARGLLAEARTYSERLFHFVAMDSLPRAASADALVLPAADEGISWEQAALDEVFDNTRGYPYFLQVFGKQTWDVARGPDRISRNDVLRAAPLVTEQLDDGFFSVRMERTTALERAYISAMASLGAGPYRSRDVADAMGRTTRQASTVRDSLIKRGLCFAPARDVIEFTVPMFDAFVRRYLQ